MQGNITGHTFITYRGTWAHIKRAPVTEQLMRLEVDFCSGTF
nr:hypothetical protein [Luminiphilus sp.]